MPITPPVSGTKVASAPWGIPITNEVNRLTTSTARMGGTWTRTAPYSVANNTAVNLPWDTENEDTNGFAAVPWGMLTVPAGCGGIYVMSYYAYIGSGTSGLIWMTGTQMYAPVSAGTNAYNAWSSLSLVTPLVPGNTIQCWVQQGSGGTITTTGRFSLYRISE